MPATDEFTSSVEKRKGIKRMSAEELTLIVGATGLLGMEIVRLLRDFRAPVRALVRPGADPAKRALLESLGAEIVSGDLKDIASLEAACRGVTAIVSTANAMISRQPGDSIQTVDGDGHVALVTLADRMDVKHFVYISFPPATIDFALQRAKRAIETLLRKGRMTFTILQPVQFCEVWLSPAVGFDPPTGRARIWGTGERLVNWVSVHDVARFAAHASRGDRFAGRVLRLGGPDALSAAQVVGIFEEQGSPTVSVELVPESVLEQQLAGAIDPIQEAYAAAMLIVARGSVVDLEPALDLLPGRLMSVRDYARQVLAVRT